MAEDDPREWKPRAREDVVFRRVGEEWLLFDPRTRRIHVLNLSSALVWTYGSGDQPPGEIHRRVEADYEESVPETEIRSILERFRSEGLLSR